MNVLMANVSMYHNNTIPKQKGQNAKLEAIDVINNTYQALLNDPPSPPPPP